MTRPSMTPCSGSGSSNCGAATVPVAALVRQARAGHGRQHPRCRQPQEAQAPQEARRPGAPGAARASFHSSVRTMHPTELDAALAVAKIKGYLVIDEPFDPESSGHAKLLDKWSSHCEAAQRNPVLVVLGSFGLWRAAIAFRAGADAEMVYVLHELKEAFRRHLGDSNRSSDEAWFASSQDRRRAEALAFELAAIDAQRRDEAFEEVFALHEL